MITMSEIVVSFYTGLCLDWRKSYYTSICSELTWVYLTKHCASDEKICLQVKYHIFLN